MEIKQLLLAPGQRKIFNDVKIEPPKENTKFLRVVCIKAEGIVSFQIHKE